MKYPETKFKMFSFLVLGLSFSLVSSVGFAQGYGPEGRVLRDGETPAPNAICQSYGYGNVMQTKCFDAEPNNGKRDTPKTARSIDLADTVESATNGEHRTVYTYRDRSGILHYTENVPAEYKKSAKVFKKGTITGTPPIKMISYPKEYAGPAVPAENPSKGDKFTNTIIPADKGISSSGVKLSNKKDTTKKSSVKVKANKKQSNTKTTTVKQQNTKAKPTVTNNKSTAKKTTKTATPKKATAKKSSKTNTKNSKK